MNTLSLKEDDAGTMLIRENNEITQYDISTNAGFWRGGKVYFSSKILTILEGRAIMTWELEGKDREVLLTPNDKEFHIPEGIPHVFYFPQFTQMVEKFPLGTRIDTFERYRAMKSDDTI